MKVLHFSPLGWHFTPLISTSLVYNRVFCIARTFSNFYSFPQEDFHFLAKIDKEKGRKVSKLLTLRPRKFFQLFIFFCFFMSHKNSDQSAYCNDRSQKLGNRESNSRNQQLVCTKRFYPESSSSVKHQIPEH